MRRIEGRWTWTALHGLSMKSLSLLLLLLATTILPGCLDDEVGSPDVSQVAMVVGVKYAVESGDRLVNTSVPQALVEVHHDLESDTRYVILLEGTADLIRR